MHDSLSSCFLTDTQKMTFKLNQVKEKEGSQSLLDTEPVNINYIKSVTGKNFDKTKCQGKDTWRDRCDTCIHFRRYTPFLETWLLFQALLFSSCPFKILRIPSSSQPQNEKNGLLASKLWWQTMWGPRKEAGGPLQSYLKLGLESKPFNHSQT